MARPPDLSVRLAPLRRLAPGLALALGAGTAASLLGGHYGAPAMLLALLIGMAFNVLADHARFAAGIGFASRTLLRLGVALLGFRLTAGDLGALGLPAVLSVAGLVAATLGFGLLAARLCGRDWRFGLLTGGSVAICGASAALALAAVLPADDRLERNTLFTVVGVTALSTLAMIAYPVLFAALGLEDAAVGFLIGATIHDVAQVVGAGFSVSEAVGETATLVKLLRVVMLPAVLIGAILATRRGGAGRAGEAAGLPLFVVAFAAFMGINSLGIAPAGVAEAASALSHGLLVTAIAALGVKTSPRAMTELGGRHALVLVLETLFLLTVAVLAVGQGIPQV